MPIAIARRVDANESASDFLRSFPRTRLIIHKQEFFGNDPFSGDDLSQVSFLRSGAAENTTEQWCDAKSVQARENILPRSTGVDVHRQVRGKFIQHGTSCRGDADLQNPLLHDVVETVATSDDLIRNFFLYRSDRATHALDDILAVSFPSSNLSLGMFEDWCERRTVVLVKDLKPCLVFDVLRPFAGFLIEDDTVVKIQNENFCFLH